MYIYILCLTHHTQYILLMTNTIVHCHIYCCLVAVNGLFLSDAYIGQFDIRNLCKNPTLKGENPTTGANTRLSANCID